MQIRCWIELFLNCWPWYRRVIAVALFFRRRVSVSFYLRFLKSFFFNIKTYCLPVLLYGCEIWHMSSSDMHKVNVAWNNCFRKMFNACWRESAKPLLYYCNTMSASLVIDRIKILFYKKTICGSNVVLRTVCCSYFNEIQRLSSAYNILLWHTSYNDVKRTFWSFFTSLLSI